MCLAVPMKVLEVSGARAVVDLGGVRRTVSLDLLEDVKVGDYLIVHAGFAIEKLKPDEAQKTLDLFREMESRPGGE
jgi:hydrogenase expression/formation protein HypC